MAQVNLVQDSPSLPGPIRDPKLINPFGIAADSNGFAWVADEGSGVATYEGPGGSTPEGTAVTIPSAAGAGTGSPAGIVFNNTSASFAIRGVSSSFLYATLDGTISGWNGQLATPSAAIAINNSATGAIYTGLAIANNGGLPKLYAANFHSGLVEVYNSAFSLTSTFTDTNLPAGYAPYNVQIIGGNLYVTFAMQDPTGEFPVAGLGNGFIDEFTTAGVFMQRLISAAPLNEPYGLAVAPATFGQFAGDLLVANQGSGQVDAFNATTGQFIGVFPDTTGAAVTIDNPHGLLFGPTGTLYFTAGPNNGTHGIFGSLTPTPQPVVITPATLALTVSNITAFVGQPFNGTIGTFTDPNIYALPTDFTASVQWGDGTTDSSTGSNVTITQTDGPGSAFLITGIHSYPTSTTGNPPEILKITVTETAGNSVSSEGTASVSSPTLHASFSGFTAIVGVPYPGAVATFTDDAPDVNLSDYTAVINWGDHTQTVGRISSANSAGQAYIVTDAGGHAYPASTVGQNPYVVSVTIAKNAKDSLGAPLVESATVMGNVAVSFPTLHVSFSTFPAIAGSAYSGQVATFTDDSPPPGLQNTGADPNSFYTATINWGDKATTVGTIVQSTTAAGAFSVLSTHAYASPTVGMRPEVVSVTVVKNLTNEAAQAIGNVAVADALLAPLNQGQLLNATEGIQFSGTVAQFTSANPFYTAATFSGSFAPVINWGDGKTSLGFVSGGNGVFSVSGVHTYASPTPVSVANTISVAVSDLGGAKTTVTNNVIVSPAPLSLISLTLPTTPGIPIVARAKADSPATS